MSVHTSPAAIVTGPRPASSVARTPHAPESLTTAVDAGLACLRNLAIVHAVVEAGSIEHRLRTALSADHPDARGHVAARVACAYLAAGSLTEAYFALLQTRDHMLDTIR